MPVPEEVLVQHVVRVFPGDIAPGVHCTSVWTQEHATAVDVIESVLEKLTIPADPQKFDLVEVYNQTGDFAETPESRGRARTLQEFESPVRVQREWEFKRGTDGVIGEYRIFLRQKTENLVGDAMPNVRVTWLDGLKPNTNADEWNFDPAFRGEEEIDDLVDLPVLNETILLEKLQSRFQSGRIYTYVGGILIAINPFKYFPIYNPKYVLSYQHKKLGELPPHIFAIADIAYHRMLKDRKNQCIVISGESGSGKTESTKLVLHHLTALSHKTQATILERTILAAGPVLEAFGNAKTCHNNNSSRFGKFTEITYGADGVVCGAVLRKYLLEKSRIVAQGDSERNYHVFYYLLVGSNPSERQALHLLNPEDYAYLNKSQCYTIDRMDESYEFLRLQESMRSIGFCGDIPQKLFTALSAVLHIGNVEFVPKERTEDAVTIKDNGVVDIVSDLLKVEKQVLVDAFTIRKTVTRGEVLIRPYKESEAIATRDGMAKALYGSIFDWIVLQINQTLKSRHQPRISDITAYSIGVLDIFGFEDFEMNSFEQFCINFANENLQFYLNQHIFKIRQDEYITEGLHWDKVDFVDNESCLHLISGRPVGLINLLDEECSLSVGTDESLLAKFNKHHSLNNYYEKPPTKEPCFSVIHYAGAVKYNIKDFKAKNQDLMRKDIVSSLKNSKMLFMRRLLGSDPVAVYKWSLIRHMICAVTLFKQAGEARRNGKQFLPARKNASWTVAKSPTERKKIKIPLNKETAKEQREVLRKATKVLNRHEAAKLRREQQRQKYNRIRNGIEQRNSMYDILETYTGLGKTRTMKCPTVIGQFQNSLTELMDTLSRSHPFFVRCLRSNKNKAPMDFDADVVSRQLQYTGMLETVKIRQAGYPCRFQINDFVKQYRNLLPKGDLTSNDEVPLCLKSLGLDPKHYQVGKNKVFMRESQYRILKEKLQHKLDAAARTMQHWVRGKLERRKFLHMRKAAITIQSAWRAYVVRKKVKAVQRKAAVKRIEEAWIVYSEKRRISSITMIQANWRGFAARRRFKDLETERNRLKEENMTARRQAEAIVSDIISPTIFSEEAKDGSSKTSVSEGLLSTSKDRTLEVKMDEDMKERAESLPPIAPRERKLRHEYTEIPEPGELLKKALSTGNLGGSHIYEQIPDVRPCQRARESGVYDEIPEMPVPSEDREGPRGVVTDSDRRARTENIKKNVLRRRSFVREKVTLSPKTSLSHVSTRGILVRTPEQSLEDKRLGSDLNLPVNESKGSLLKLFRTLKRGNVKTRASNQRNAESPLSTGGKEWKPSKEFVVDGDDDLKAFNEFLFKRITDMDSKGNDTVSLFKKALSKYHSNLLTTYAGVKNRNGKIQLRYEEMSSTFTRVLEKEVEKSKEKLPTDVGINLFGSIIDEFVKHHVHSTKKKTFKPEKRSKKSEYTVHNGHKYVTADFNIATFCEYCNSFIWDRGFVCQGCKFTCHKKCSSKYGKPCEGKAADDTQIKSIFGAKLSQITTEETSIPKIVEELMEEVEKNGIYTEGIYRKPGLKTSVDSLKNIISPPTCSSVDLSQYRVHVITSVLKLFFRRLSEPLVPSDLYNDFIRSAELQNATDIQLRLFDVIQRFPKPNRDVMTRLIYHLGQVAMHEESNKMSPNGLAIVWAPCLMRSGEGTDSIDALEQLPLQTKCLEVLIELKAASIRRTLSDIETLQKAKLTSERTLSCFDEGGDGQILQEQIKTMDKERERLTDILPTLERVNSRGDVRVDSDDGITSDDCGTDNDDSMSFEVSVTSSLQSPPFPLQQRRGAMSRREPDHVMGSDGTLSPDSSFEDISSEISDFTL